MQALDADQEWRNKAKDEALDQLSRKNYNATKDILLFVIKKKSRDFVAVPSAMHQALARKERPPSPPPRRTADERARWRGGVQAHGSDTRDDNVKPRGSRGSMQNGVPGVLSSFKKHLMGVPSPRYAASNDIQAELVLGDVSLEQIGLNGGGGSKRSVGLNDAEFEHRLAPLDIGLGTGFSSSPDGSIHSKVAGLIYDDVEIGKASVGSQEQTRQNAGNSRADAGVLERTASSQTIRAVQLNAITIRVRTTRSVPKHSNFHHVKRSSVSSMASMMSAGIHSSQKSSMHLGHLLHLGNWKHGSQKMVHHAELSWSDAVIMDIIHALNDMDCVIRNDQLTVDFEADDDPDVLYVHFSDTADVGNMTISAEKLAKDFISQSHSKGSMLRRLTTDNP
eukprot:2830025-Rhodomonas_salina.1